MKNFKVELNYNPLLYFNISAETFENAFEKTVKLINEKTRDAPVNTDNLTGNSRYRWLRLNDKIKKVIEADFKIIE